jgi:hypothetical protein
MGKTLKELNPKIGDVVIYDNRDEYPVGVVQPTATVEAI